MAKPAPEKEAAPVFDAEVVTMVRRKDGKGFDVLAGVVTVSTAGLKVLESGCSLLVAVHRVKQEQHKIHLRLESAVAK